MTIPFTSLKLDCVLTMVVGISMIAPTLHAQESDSNDLKNGVDMLSLFEPREYSSGEGQVLKYRLMKPIDYQPSKKYPLVIFLHGAGERGDDNQVQLKHGMKDFADPERRKKFACFVIAPQCPQEQRWSDVDWSARTHAIPENASPSMKMVMEVVDTMIESSGVDRTRIYLTGLSMGGYGTWDAIARYPGKFAAAVPICGGGDPNSVDRIGNLPIWAFHGDKDTVVIPERSRDMIDALKKAGVTPKYTEYPGVGHDSWTATYSNPELYEWLFAQRLGK